MLFKQLVNEARLNFRLMTASPLAIRSGRENTLEPGRPDMQCVRTYYQGQETVYIPGSSLKGVIRSRAEQIVSLLGGQACNPVDRGSSCSRQERELREAGAAERYRRVCPACRIFGSTLVAARAAFPDAFPVGQVKTGEKAGVGINRITGGAQSGALFQQEVVESATFVARIFLTNYELWQLKVLLWALQDIHDGYVALGGGSTRGLGRMEVGGVSMEVRDYRQTRPERLLGYEVSDAGGELCFQAGPYFWSSVVEGLETCQQLVEDIDVRIAVTREV